METLQLLLRIFFWGLTMVILFYGIKLLLVPLYGELIMLYKWFKNKKT